MRNSPDQLDWQFEVFGVDFETNEVVLCGGERFGIEAWRDPIGMACDPHFARAAIFRGPSGLPFVVDIYAHHLPDGTH